MNVRWDFTVTISKQFIYKQLQEAYKLLEKQEAHVDGVVNSILIFKVV